MANLLNFSPDEQLIILYEMSNAVLIEALSRYSGHTQQNLRITVLSEVQKQIPKISHSNLQALVDRVRASRTDAYNSAVDNIFKEKK